MIQNLIISFNIIGPIFVLILMGALLRKKKMFDEAFVKKANNLIYTFALPTNMFYQIYKADFNSIQNVDYIIYGGIVTLAIVVILSLIVPIFIHNKKRCGAFVQNAFRSNFVLLGTVMATSLFGETGAISTILLIPVAVIILTICSIVVLTVFSGEEGTKKINVKSLLLSIVKNPVIIGIVLGFVVKFVNITLPVFAVDSVESFSGIVTPLALLCLGAEIKFEKMNDMKSIIFCSLIKLVLVPALAMVPAIMFFDFSGYELGALFFLFCAPCGISNYSLIYSMKSDYEFASRVIVVSSFISFVTMIIGITLFIQFGIFSV